MKIRKSASIVLGLLIVSTVTAVVVAAQQSSQFLGKTNLQAWIDEAPGLPNNLEEAVVRKSGGSFYQPFYDKVEAFKKSYKQAVASRVKADETTTRKAAEAEVSSSLARLNSNPAIAQMGGLERLAQMTPEQRAKAAQLMMQSMQQKEADLRKLMAAEGAQSSRTAQPKQEVLSPAGQETAARISIQEDLQRMLQERGTIDTAFRTRDDEITNGKGGQREINQDAVGKLAAIPMVNDPIMGRVHDLGQEAALNKQTAARHRDRASWELQQRAALLADQKLKLKDLATTYQNWLKNNQDKINGSTEIAVAEYEVSFIDAAYDLTKYSEAVTKDVASYEEMNKHGHWRHQAYEVGWCALAGG